MMLRLAIAVVLVLGVLSAEDGFLPSRPPAVKAILEEFYFPQSPFNADDLELVQVEYKLADAPFAVKYRITFNVVAKAETCQIQVFEQKWGGTKRYLQYDLCKRFATFALHDAEGFLPSAPLVVEEILNEFYFPQSPLTPDELQLIKVEYKVADAPFAIKFRITFQVVGQEETCEIQVYEQKWGDTKRYLQYDLCRRFADRREGEDVPFAAPGSFKRIDINDSNANRLLNQVYFPRANHNSQELKLTGIEQKLVYGDYYRYHFDYDGDDRSCTVEIHEEKWVPGHGPMQRIVEDTCY